MESVIESCVQTVLEESPSRQHHIILVGKLVDALESDVGWVELYGITGELIVPNIHEEQSEIGELLKKARQVSMFYVPPWSLIFQLFSFWPSIFIQNRLRGFGEKLKYQSTFQS